MNQTRGGAFAAMVLPQTGGAMGNFWVGLAITVGALIVVGVASGYWVFTSVSSERVTPVTALSAQGNAGTALLVAHPGLSDFPDRLADAFAEGLVAQGWRVERTTPSREAPADLSAYGLLILASPIYGGLPAKPMQDYLARLDLGGLRVAIVLAGSGITSAAVNATANFVAAAGGQIVGRYAYTSMQPNEPPAGTTYPGSNIEIGIAMARDAGRSLAQSL